MLVGVYNLLSLLQLLSSALFTPFCCCCCWWQGGITCEAIDEPGTSSEAIDKHVIINFRDKNVVSARFRDKNEAFILLL